MFSIAGGSPRLLVGLSAVFHFHGNANLPIGVALC